MRSDGSLRQPLGWTLVALLVAYLPQLPGKPLWITGLVLACIGLRWWAEVRRGRLTSAWVRTPIGVICFVAVLQAYGGTLNGVVPGSALLSVMAALKVLESRTRRDLFVLLFIALFLVLTSFLVEQHLWSVLFLAVGFGVITTAWLAVARRGKPRPARWLIAQATRHIALAAPVVLAMWVLFPRVPGPFWAIPTQGGTANTGLSGEMSPGDISALSQSQKVAFRADFDGLPPTQDQLYWRAIVMHRFDGRTWKSDDPERVQSTTADVRARGEQSSYTVTMEPTGRRWLFALDMPDSWEGRRIYRSRFQTLERERPVDERLKYRARSFLSYSVGTELPPRARRWYTALPADSNPRAREFARALLAESTDTRSFITAVLAHFRDEPFFYTLTPPPLAEHSVDGFLFGTRRGFCEHYASSFAFLMRAAGVPARVVAGYQGGEINPIGGHLTVRQSDAHAWTEVWLPDVGWSRVDPTAAVAPQRIEQGLDSALRESGERVPTAFDLPILERLQLSWDMINARWNEWVLGYGPETQRALFSRFGIDNVDWRDLTVMLAVILVSLMSGVSIYLWVRHQPPPPDAPTRWYRALQRRTALPAMRGETPHQWAHRAMRARPQDAVYIQRFTRSYMAARYGGDAARITEIQQAVRRVRWRWGSRLRSLARGRLA